MAKAKTPAKAKPARKRAGKAMAASRPARSRKYTQETADTILRRIAEGESLRAICVDADMPDRITFLRWLAEDETLRDQYARARETQADTYFEQIREIADTPLIGEKVKTLPGGGMERTVGDMIEHRRLQVDARKWMASKLAPKKYGDKLELGSDPERPVTINLNLGGAK